MISKPGSTPKIIRNSSLEYEYPVVVVPNTRDEAVDAAGTCFPGQEGWGGRFLATTNPGDIFLHHQPRPDIAHDEQDLFSDLRNVFNGQLATPEDIGYFRYEGNELVADPAIIARIKKHQAGTHTLVAFCLNHKAERLANELGINVPMFTETRDFCQNKVNGTHYLTGRGTKYPEGNRVLSIAEALKSVRSHSGEVVFKVAQSSSGLGTSKRIKAGEEMDKRKVMAILESPEWSGHLATGLRVEQWVPNVLMSIGQAYDIQDGQIRISDPTQMLLGKGNKYQGSITMNNHRKLVEELYKRTESTTRSIRDYGGRGNGAVDYILDRDGNIFTTENNQRITGQSALKVALSKLNQEVGVVYTSKPTSLDYQAFRSVCNLSQTVSSAHTIPIAIIPREDGLRQYHYLVLGDNQDRESLLGTINYVQANI